MGEFQKALKIATEKSNELKSPAKKSLSLPLLIAEIYSLYRLGEYDSGLAKYKIGMEIIDSLAQDERDEGTEWIALFKNVIGITYHSKGDLNSALELFEESLRLREGASLKKDIAISLNNIGAVYAYKGDLDNALKYYGRSFESSESINNQEGMAYSLNNLGTIYEQKGDNKRALDYYKRSLIVKERIGNNYDIAGSLHNIGVIYHNKGSFFQSLEYFERSLLIKKSIGNDLYTASTLYEIILLNLDMDILIDANKNLKYLAEINSRKSNKTINLYYRLSKALILKKSKRMFEKSQAQLILKEIANEEVILFKLSLLAMVNLCELLLFELKLVGEVEILVEARNLVKKLYNLAQSQESYSLAVKVLILRARFAIIGGELKIALENLEKGEEIANKNNLDFLLLNIKEEKKTLESEYEKWQKLIEQNAPIQERLEQFRLEEYTKEIKKLVSWIEK
jgi:tetratricopeptide (TPR) repeat protein